MQEEKYNTRDRSYSAWHRRYSTQSFVGIERAQLLAMIDMDACLYVEYDDGTKEVLCLVETAIDNGQKYKTATVTRNLAKAANVPAFTLLYKISRKPLYERTKQEADKKWFDIEQFRVKCIWPRYDSDWKIITPMEWAQILLKIREWSANNLDKKIDERKINPDIEKEKEKKLITKIEQLSLFKITTGATPCSST